MHSRGSFGPDSKTQLAKGMPRIGQSSKKGKHDRYTENVFDYNIGSMKIGVDSKSIWLSLAGVSVFLSSRREGVS